MTAAPTFYINDDARALNRKLRQLTALVGTGGGGAVAWADITGKPATFPPEAHTNAMSDVTGLDAALAGKSALGHGHAIADVTGLQTALDGKQAAGSYQPLATVLTNTTAAFTTAQETKLAGIATGATANDTDANLKSRTNHTGTQTASTISDFSTAADARAAAAIATHEAAVDPHPGYLTAAEGNAAYQPLDSDLTAIAALSTTAYGRALLALANAAELTALPNVFSSSLQGMVPASGGGTTTFLRADGTFAAPSGGADPWTYVKVAVDFVTSSATAVNVTGLAFTPGANKSYEFEALLMLRTATATVGPRPGIAWATGLTDGVADIYMPTSGTAQVLVFGNANAALLAAVGGLPNTTQSYPARLGGMAIAGASPSGTIKVQMASETAGTTVTVKAGSWLKYREI